MVIDSTIAPESIVPKSRSGKDLRFGVSKRKAASAPVMPPKNGIGIAARIKIAQGPNFSILAPALERVCSNSQSKIFLKKAICPDKNCSIGSSKNIITTIVAKVPNTDQSQDSQALKPYMLYASGRAARSSVTGIMDIKKVPSHFGNPSNQLNIISCIF